MKIFVLLMITAAFAAHSWASDRCSVVRAIRNGGVIGIKGYTLGDCKCLIIPFILIFIFCPFFTTFCLFFFLFLETQFPPIDVCLAYQASRYDTSLNRSPTEYGIFQINSYWWCDDGRTVGRKNLCGMSCRSLLNSNIGDDVRCLRRIVRDPNGLDAWSVWTRYCKGRDLSSYASWC
uniref:MGC89221 protein n=1 Tax=Xenopus tropicalis TaxID=8364 RepID=A0A6I8RJ71_XENTR